jgi:hypothetical protein
MQHDLTNFYVICTIAHILTYCTQNATMAMPFWPFFFFFFSVKGEARIYNLGGKIEKQNWKGAKLKKKL